MSRTPGQQYLRSKVRVCVFQEVRADGHGLDDAPEERQADEELPGAKARPKSKEWC